MKGLVVYYSQTGNTKKITQAIHVGIKQVIQACDIAPLKEVKARDLIDYHLIGILTSRFPRRLLRITALCAGFVSRYVPRVP